MTQPRIPPLPMEDWDPAVGEALAMLAPAAASTRPPQASDTPRRPTNIVGIYAWHPALTKGLFAYFAHLFHSTLSDRLREMVTVRTGWVRKAEYEWAQHVRMAGEVGMTPVEVDAISEGPDSPVWGEFESAVLRAVDELCEDRYISDATWETLSAELDRLQLMDLVFTVGAYDLLGMAMNTFGLELDPGLVRFPLDRT